MKKVIMLILPIVFISITYYSFNNQDIVDKLSKYFTPNIEYKNFTVKISDNMHLFLTTNNNFTQYFFGFIHDNKITRYLVNNFIHDELKMFEDKIVTKFQMKFTKSNMNPKAYLLFDNSQNEYEIYFFRSDYMKDGFAKQYENLINSKKIALYSDAGNMIVLNSEFPVESYSIISTKIEDNKLKNIIYFFKINEYIITIRIYVNNENLEHKRIMKKLFNAVYKAK